MLCFIIHQILIHMRCIKCGKKLAGNQKKFCSRVCKNRYWNSWTQIYERQREKGLRRKLEAINIKGGKCEICGYSKNYAGLIFHHLNPAEKEFNVDIRKFSNLSWKRLLNEINKCQLLCHNCHMEVEYPHLKMVGPVGIEPTLNAL